ncbi:hypothetical protein RO3G_10626 [Rhizopus delemar RA 99-880]|uniref:Tc1-like transposase DDE domain-containing protein n=3 Tax=Rhizopus TaxID=4842 RepID=I1CBT6_RHIO9|nr:hypothetical protein RO3G_10626 [Rhizopus delemar RA 99-880]|eukprot:EIE85916.1 hypothetical protein RO3G_10626 [Rhizopus delemar RA 99-880]
MSAFLHRGTSLTIFGAIDHRDLVSLSVRLSVGQQETKVLWTMKCVYFKFLTSLTNMRKNAIWSWTMHRSTTLKKKRKETVSKRGYHCVYWLPYSSFLNPIEEFGANQKRPSAENASKLAK